MAKKTVEQWKPIVQEVVESKMKEFHSLGYNSVSEEELWDCLVHTVWKGNPEKYLHEIVQDIFQLKTQVFMNYLTMQTYQDDNLLESIEALMKQESSK